MASNSKKYQNKGVSLKFLGWIMSIVVLIISATLVVSLVLVYQQNNVVNETNDNCIALKQSSNDIQSASDYLTAQARLFVANADKQYMDNYFKEANVTKRREKAVEEIHRISESTTRHEDIHEYINTAMDESRNLMQYEFYAMKLICVAQNVSFAEYSEVANANIEAVAPENRKSEALNAVLGSDYVRCKDKITYNISLALEVIDNLMSENQKEAERNLQSLIVFQSIVIGVNIAFAIAVLLVLYGYIIKPMTNTLEAIENNEEVRAAGSREFNYLVDAYNIVRSQNEKVKEKLAYEAEHDKLTNLYNRTGYASLYRTMRLSRTLYILMDIDGFKEINDKFGHDIGDRVLVKLADTLEANFPEENASIFRIGGDEFAILIENIDKEMDNSIVERVEKINSLLSVSKGKIPPFTLSIGIAHGDEDDTTDTLFKKADNALYEVKNTGKSGAKYNRN